jgi:hypothetical protein
VAAEGRAVSGVDWPTVVVTFVFICLLLWLAATLLDL